MSNTILNAKELLFGKDSDKTHRLTLQATLVPVTGDLFQPAGFPDIGHVFYDAPRANGQKEKVCIVDSAASMANHLEAVSLDSSHTLEIHSDLAGLPYVELFTDETGTTDGKSPTRLVVTSLSEGHRLASSYFLDEKGRLIADGKVTTNTFIANLRQEFGMRDLGKKTHPLPGDWWNVFKAIFRYDPNSLVHGILFPSLGIKLARVLTAQHEAFGAERVSLSGVKFDKLGKTSSGQPIFAVDKQTAREIRATFVIDLALIRSFGRSEVKDETEIEIKGLNRRQKEFLLELALWKIGRLLSGPYRFRSGCDLKCERLTRLDTKGQPEIKPESIGTSLGGYLSDEGDKSLWATQGYDKKTKPLGKAERVTKVYWPADALFKTGNDDDAEGGSETEGND